MSIREFSAGLQKHVFDKISTSSDEMRNIWQSAYVNQLNLDRASVDSLLEQIMIDDRSMIHVKKGQDPNEIFEEVALDIHEKAAAVQDAISHGDINKLKEITGIDFKSLQTTDIHNEGKRITMLQDEEQTGTWAGKDVLFNFKTIAKIRDYIFTSGKTNKRGLAYDLTGSIEQGHVLGLVARQFHDAQEYLESLMTANEEKSKLLQQLFKYMRDLLIEQDLQTSNIPGSGSNLEKLSWVIKRTATVRDPTSSKNVPGMMVEFQHYLINQASGQDSKALKAKLTLIVNTLAKKDLPTALSLRKSKSKTLEAIPGIKELRKYLETEVSDPEEVKRRWVKGLERHLTKELFRLTGDKNFVIDFIRMRGSPSYEDVIVSKLVAAIAKNQAKELKLNQYNAKIKQKTKTDPLITRFRADLKQSIAKLKKAEQDAKKAEAKIRSTKQKASKLLKTAERTLKLQSNKQADNTLSPARLKYLLNVKLGPTIKKYMGRPNLINRTGRFAASATVLEVTPRNKAVDIFYTYMKYPYQTFEPGFRMGGYGYDPRRVIEQSIREIATSLVTARFRTVRV